MVIPRGSKYYFFYPSFAVTEAGGHGIKEVINEVSEKGAGLKLVFRTSSLNREKSSMLLLMPCY